MFLSTYIYESYWDDFSGRTDLSTADVQALLDAARSHEEWLRILRWVGPPPLRARAARPKPPSPLDKRAILMDQDVESLHCIRRGDDVAHLPGWHRDDLCLIDVTSRGRRIAPHLSDDNPWAGTTYLNRNSPRRQAYADWRNYEDDQ